MHCVSAGVCGVMGCNWRPASSNPSTSWENVGGGSRAVAHFLFPTNTAQVPQQQRWKEHWFIQHSSTMVTSVLSWLKGLASKNSIRKTWNLLNAILEYRHVKVKKARSAFVLRSITIYCKWLHTNLNIWSAKLLKGELLIALAARRQMPVQQANKWLLVCY